jgi:hypothetical protein
LVFNEDCSLSHKWHYAGADVQMTIRLIDAYFCRTQGSPIPGKIEAFFQLKPSRGMTTELEHQVEVIDAECRDKVKLSHLSDDEPVLTVENWNELEAEVAGVGWDDALSDGEDWDSEDENWNTDEEDKDSDDGDMGRDDA